MKIGGVEDHVHLSVSQSNLAAVQAYLEKQREHHRVKTFKDDFREILVKHDLEYGEEMICLQVLAPKGISPAQLRRWGGFVL